MKPTLKLCCPLCKEVLADYSMRDTPTYDYMITQSVIINQFYYHLKNRGCPKGTPKHSAYPWKWAVCTICDKRFASHEGSYPHNAEMRLAHHLEHYGDMDDATHIAQSCLGDGE